MDIEEYKRMFKKAKEYEKCFKEQEKESRHISKGTETVNYQSWKDFDIVSIFAANSPHPLKSVCLGYAYRGDIPCNDKLIATSSISTEVTKAASYKSITIQILSYDEAIKKAKSIDWNKVKIEK